MKFTINWTNNLSYHEIREYKDLEECVNTLLEKEDFNGCCEPHELVIRRPYRGDPECTDDPVCDYVVEVYNDWRE